jgi:glycosyltransferase involved in cell wall biosynthesis
MALIQRRLASSTAAALAVSHAVRQWAIRHYALPPERVEVLYPGHDLDRFPVSGGDMRAQVRHELQIPGEAAVIGLFGRIAREKGQLLMIQLMPELLKHRPGVVLLIVGEGPDLGDCHRIVAKLGLAAAVRFAGHRRDIPEVMAATDVVVVPSLWEEAFGLVAVEASAAGRPVVAFRSGGLSEVIIHNRTGLIVTKGDSAGLRNALEYVLSRPELARRLGESGRRHAAQFTIEPHVQRLISFHEAVLGQRELGTSLATPARLP